MTRVYVTLSVLLTVAAVVATLVVYPRLPAEIPTHWNIQGQIDDYGSKTWAAFLLPGIMVGLLLLFWAIPWLSPKHFEVDTFRSTYWFIVLVVTCTMGYIHVLILWAALAGPVDTTRALLSGLLIMFGLIGNVLGKVRRNFWVGVRTPWTIASERVWNDTHRLAAKMFVGAAIIGLLTLALPVSLPAVSVAVVALILIASFWPVVYSLLLYKRLERQGNLERDTGI